MLRTALLIATAVISNNEQNEPSSPAVQPRRLGPGQLITEQQAASKKSQAQAAAKRKAQQAKLKAKKTSNSAKFNLSKKPSLSSNSRSPPSPKRTVSDVQKTQKADSIAMTEREAMAQESAYANNMKKPVTDIDGVPNGALHPEGLPNGAFHPDARPHGELNPMYDTHNLGAMKNPESVHVALAENKIAVENVIVHDSGATFVKTFNAEGKDVFRQVQMAEDGRAFIGKTDLKVLPKGGTYRGAHGRVRKNGEQRPRSMKQHYTDKSMMWVGQVSMLPMLLITPSMMGFMGRNGAIGGMWYDQWMEMLGVGDFNTTKDSKGRKIWDLERGAMNADKNLRDACGNFIDTHEWNVMHPDEKHEIEKQGFSGAPCMSKWPYSSMHQHTDFSPDNFHGCPPNMSYSASKKQYIHQRDKNPKYVSRTGDEPEWNVFTHMVVTFVDNMGKPMDCHGNSVSETLFMDDNPLLMLTTADKQYNGCDANCSQIWRFPKECQREELDHQSGYPLRLMDQCYSPMPERFFWRIYANNGQVQPDVSNVTANMDGFPPYFHDEFLLTAEKEYALNGPDPNVATLSLQDLKIFDPIKQEFWLCNVTRERLGLATTPFGSGLGFSELDKQSIPVYEDDGPCNYDYWNDVCQKKLIPKGLAEECEDILGNNDIEWGGIFGGETRPGIFGGGEPEPETGGFWGQSVPEPETGGYWGQPEPEPETGGYWGQPEPEPETGGYWGQPEPETDDAGSFGGDLIEGDDNEDYWVDAETDNAGSFGGDLIEGDDNEDYWVDAETDDAGSFGGGFWGREDYEDVDEEQYVDNGGDSGGIWAR